MILNIEDVKRRLQLNPEPPEVKEMRSRILESFKNLEFIEEGHTYWLHDPNGGKISVPSVSSLVEEFVPKVDWDKIKIGKAKKENVTVEELTRQWEENNIRSTNNGTSVHLYGENMMNFMLGSEDFNSIIKPQYEKGYLIPLGPKQDAIQRYWQDLWVIPDIYPLLPEVKMYMPLDNKFGIKKLYCGTADITLAYKYNNEWCILLQDYKGLPLDTPIATPLGWKNMGDLQKGDTVFDKNGIPTKILNVSTVHNNPCLKLIFDDNTSMICDEDHRWETFVFKDRLVGKKKTRIRDYTVMTAKEIFSYISNPDNRGKKNLKSHKVLKIDVQKPIQCEEQQLPIHPYVLGVWLGDGNKCDGKVTNMYKELWEEIENCGYKIGKDVSQGGAGKAQTRTIFGLTAELRKLDLLYNKHIPNIYLRASYDQRLDLLRGIMDTDGYYNKTRNRFVLETTREYQSDFCTKILASLGIKYTVIKSYATIKDGLTKKRFDKWDVVFTTDIYPFKVRKIKIKPTTSTRHTFKVIKKVEYVDTVQTKCIEVDSPTHTYCCGYDMIVTHNTNKSLVNDYSKKYNKIMLPPFNNLIEQPQSHYTIQLSLYSLMLMNLGFKVIDRRLIWLKEDGTYDKVPVPDVTNELIKYYSK